MVDSGSACNVCPSGYGSDTRSDAGQALHAQARAFMLAMDRESGIRLDKEMPIMAWLMVGSHHVRAWWGRRTAARRGGLVQGTAAHRRLQARHALGSGRMVWQGRAVGRERGGYRQRTRDVQGRSSAPHAERCRRRTRSQ